MTEYFDFTGEPIKCPVCGATQECFEKVNVCTDASFGIVEYDVECKCGEYLASHSYGSWFNN